jgi:RNA polymerase sigma factor (sigma-70 family)
VTNTKKDIIMGYAKKKQDSVFEREAKNLLSLKDEFLSKCRKGYRQKGISREDVEDFVQQAFFKVLDAIKERGVSEEGHNLIALLNTTYNRLLINHIKGLKPTKSVIINAEGEARDITEILVCRNNQNPLKSLMIAEMFEVIESVLSDKDEEVKNVWELYFNGYKYRQIADELDMNINTVGSHIKKIKDKVLPIFKEKDLRMIFDDMDMDLGRGVQDDM